MIEKRKKVLVIIPRVPYPLNSGGSYLTYETLKFLKKHYEVFVVVIDDKSNANDQEDAMKEVTNEYYYFGFSKFRFYWNVIKGMFTSYPLQVNYFYFNKVQKKVDELLSRVDFAYVFINRTAKYCFNTDKPVVMNAIDSIYLSYSNSLNNTQSLFWNTIYKIEVKRLYEMEKTCLEKFRCCFFVNTAEADFWKQTGNSFAMPFGVKESLLTYNQKSDQYKNVIAFFGKMDYRPNIDAVVWFCQNVLKHLNTNIEFWIMGDCPTKTVYQLEKDYERVKVTGFVDDPYLIIRSCICTVSPMQSGGALLTKMLMSMAVESIVISTSLPMAGLPQAKNGEHVIIEDDPIKMAMHINSIQENPGQYQTIGKKARELMQHDFGWQMVEEKTIGYIDQFVFNEA